MDILRGLSIFFMLMIHVAKYWSKDSALWLVGLQFLTVNIMGTSQFTYVAGLSFSFSYYSHLMKNNSKEHAIKKSLSRTIVLIILSFGYNGFQVLVVGDEWNGLWAWNILQTIAFCRFLAIFFMSIPKYSRGIIAVIWVFLTELIVNWLLLIYQTDPSAGTVYRIFFNPIHADGILFFFPFFLLGTIFGELIFEISHHSELFHHKSVNELNFDPKNKVIKTLKLCFFAGLFLFISGILLGVHPQGLERDYYHLIPYINLHPNIQIASLPFFLLPNSYPWVFYCAGWQIMLTSVLYYLIDFKEHKPKLSNIFIMFGRYSLTIYLTQYIFLFLPSFCGMNFKFITFGLIISIILFEILQYIFVQFLEKKGKGKYSIEYVIKNFSTTIANKILYISSNDP